MLNLTVLHFDPFPFGLLTMVVSLEAIFLSTFVLISQNRYEERQHMVVDHHLRRDAAARGPAAGEHPAHRGDPPRDGAAPAHGG